MSTDRSICVFIRQKAIEQHSMSYLRRQRWGPKSVDRALTVNNRK